MASVIGICNSALVKLGASTIVSLTEGTKNANLCNEQYDKVRDALLRAHPWSFAIARAKLAQLAVTPTFGWDHAYQLPADFLRVVAVYDNDDGVGTVPYAVEGRTLLSDADDLYLRYVRREDDPNRFDALFREALAFRLAADLAIPIVQSNTLAERMTALADRMARKARAADSIEDYPERMPDGAWLTARA